ncbi:MAG: glycosyltransferase family 4 protein [bacterium]|nr:glycosyltransferase family 4 protein [bacterium]
MKIAILTSHVIQYQAPLFRKFAVMPGIDLTVYFCWDFGAKKMFDPEFGCAIEWDIILTEGYRHLFPKNFSLKPGPSFLGQINLGIIPALWKGKYDAVIVYGWNSLTNWLAFATAFLRRTPVLLHGENPMNQESLKSGRKRAVKKIILGMLFRRVSGFLYIGEENRKFYEYYGVPKKKLFFVPYAVENDRYIEVAKTFVGKKPELKKKLGVLPDHPLVLFVGKLIGKKRPLDLLQAYELLITHYSLPITPSLLFVGDGELRQTLEAYAQDHGLKNVRFAGFKNQSELPECYAVADVFVLPSGIGETWGLVVNEAMCFGLPVVVSDIVGCGSDLVHRNENGFIFRLGNIDELAECIRKLVESRERVENFGKRSKEIIAHYSHEKDIEGIKEALDLIFNDIVVLRE